MAVYSKLLLSAGGGIVSTTQQAEQTKNTATLLIGLGGTGIDCLRTIKTQVRSRLRPDDPDAVVPTYSHIRFLGVDTAETSGGDQDDENQENVKAGGVLALDDTELFPIANGNVKRVFANPQGLEMREDLSWLRWEDIKAPDLTRAGAGGIRQVGRFMMMDRSAAFMNRLEQEINMAKSGLGSPNLNIHIFAGLSGGTGSGCFLDVCYMVRHVANKLGAATIYGYFFLPDVNLSKIPMSNAQVRAYIPCNGYAAMQELDYCMQLQFNGGQFVQKYQNNVSVEWKGPPVDMCHLICATDSNNNVIPNAYDYAMNVTAEYLMDFLTHSKGFGLDQHLANFTAMVNAADGKKIIGSHLAYCVIGASCASLPLREVNTYLASHLFEKFGSLCTNVPTKADVEKLACTALARNAQNISGIYMSLQREISEGFSDGYDPYADDWKFVRDYGNSELVTHYTNQNAAKLNLAQSNAKSMTTVTNEKSLIARVNAQLQQLCCQLEYGPTFAYGMLDAAKSHNMLNIVDGLIEENNQRWNQEAAQTNLREREYEAARSTFEQRKNRKLFDTDASRFEEYEFRLQNLIQHRLFMERYAKLDEVLKLFRKQVEELTATYYIKLNRVFETLVNSFKENRDALASEKIMQSTNSFAIPMMTIAELKKPMDEQIEKINVPGMLDAFMRLLLDHPEAWLAEDENKIAKLVNKFFVETAFGDFSSRTITVFLKDKYGITDDAQLTNKVYNDWMKKLTAKASPLFYFDKSVWDETQSSKLAFVSVPESSAAIKAAANQMNTVDATWQVKESNLTDRIFVMCSACALPLSSYSNCSEYEHAFFSSPDNGRHYYEGKPVEGMKCYDWRKLASLTPQSLLRLDNAPYQMRDLTVAAQKLYDEAQPFNIFSDDCKIQKPDPDGVDALKKLIAATNAMAAKIERQEEIPAAKELLAQLEAARTIPMVYAGYSMPNVGLATKRETKLRVQKDHFVAAPGYHDVVRGILDQMKSVDAEAQAAAKLLGDKVTAIGVGNASIRDYCDALFTGVIALEGRMVVYRKSEYGMITETVLSKRGGDFPYNAIPVYQGYLSYQSLLSEEDKAAIRKLVDDRYNMDAPEIRTAGTMLKTELADNKVQAWSMAADAFADKAKVMDFIKKLKQQFSIFCMENGI